MCYLYTDLVNRQSVGSIQNCINSFIVMQIFQKLMNSMYVIRSVNKEGKIIRTIFVLLKKRRLFVFLCTYYDRWKRL